MGVPYEDVGTGKTNAGGGPACRVSAPGAPGSGQRMEQTSNLSDDDIVTSRDPRAGTADDPTDDTGTAGDDAADPTDTQDTADDAADTGTEGEEGGGDDVADDAGAASGGAGGG